MDKTMYKSYIKASDNIDQIINEHIENAPLNPLRVSILNMGNYMQEAKQFIEKIQTVRFREISIRNSDYDYINFLKKYIDGINKIINKIENSLKDFYLEPELMYDLLNTKERFTQEMSEDMLGVKSLEQNLNLYLNKIRCERGFISYYSELQVLYQYMVTLFDNLQIQINNAFINENQNLIFSK